MYIVNKSVMMIGVVTVMALFGGCSTIDRKASEEEFQSSRPAYLTPPQPVNGAIYQSGYEMSLYDDMKARRVGDIITIVLLENTNASKKASTNTAKDSSMAMANPTLFGRKPSFSLPRPFQPSINGMTLETSIDSKNSFKGEGDSSQSNSLTGNITVSVAEVLPNGNLFVRGQKRLTINQGDELVQFSGYVRAADIRPDNTVISSKVADAKIAYIGEGTLADVNSQGWLGRFFNSKWWPF
ncbi:MAG: flagellar basal body L-ring protein FlgH [Gammaproteobacteria bacterium]|nr:flagellar basal body L-ring protein FlgH [Gammaproteobacteria bacterium]